MIYYYIAAISLALMLYVFYLQVCSLRWDEVERRRLEQVELSLAHILRLLEAPDVRLLMQHTKSRQNLFLEFSDFLMGDVKTLLRLRALRMSSIAFVGVFFASYYLMRLKARLFCSRNDLRFLTGLELVFFRSLQ